MRWMRAGLRDFAEAWGAEAVSGRQGKYYLSLGAANRQMLEAAGIGRIVDVNECTCCAGGYSSYRRQGADAFALMMVLSIDPA